VNAAESRIKVRMEELKIPKPEPPGQEPEPDPEPEPGQDPDLVPVTDPTPEPAPAMGTRSRHALAHRNLAPQSAIQKPAKSAAHMKTSTPQVSNSAVLYPTPA